MHAANNTQRTHRHRSTQAAKNTHTQEPMYAPDIIHNPPDIDTHPIKTRITRKRRIKTVGRCGETAGNPRNSYTQNKHYKFTCPYFLVCGCFTVVIQN
ncbi:hypothetical protein HHUSO_G2507 [Huso huso]|uniref:Uncharacterized protein n=1 Tax=Huso huso TaxID=61971 RepID=A0ABR1A7G8_HUSHU